MRLALECPSDLLPLVQPLADFDWILVDKYLDDDEYANWYRESTNVKFVDNSVTEKGEPYPIEELVKVFEDCKGTYLISPDWINEKDRTVEAYKEMVTYEAGKYKQALVGVLQGETPFEALECLEEYEHSYIIAIPYRVGGSKKGDPNWLMALRRSLVAAHIPNERLVHLLGFTALDELMWYISRPNIFSIDTDVPVRAGLAVQDIDEFNRTTDVSNIALDKENFGAICRNIALLRKAMVLWT